MEHIVRINSIQQVTHDVRSYRFTKPEGYSFVPGQATEVSLNKPGWEEQKRPFTFTSLNEWTELELTIKQYDDHDGVTHHIGRLQVGDEFIIRDVWGAIAYKGEGYFIAGGAGITPFIAIFRQLHRDKKIESNRLYFSNKTVKDIILHDEFDAMMGKNAHYIITGESDSRYGKGYIDREFLKREIKDFKKPFYICGPDKMVSGISEMLVQLGANPEAVVFEK